jgi:hypothetical protein
MAHPTAPIGPARRTHAGAQVAAAVYTIVAAAITWPLLRDMGARILGDAGDPILNASILVWNATVLPFSGAWWNAPHFYPTPGVTTFTESLLGVYPIASPIYWLTGNPLLTYNLTMFLTWPLCGLAVFVLVRRLVDRDDAAFLAGLAFAFTPYRGVAVYHLQTVAIFGLAFALAGLHGYLQDGRRRWLVLFGLGWLQQGLANGYYILYGGLLIGLWLAYFCSTRDGLRRGAPIVRTGALASIPLVPLLLTYRAVHDTMGIGRTLSEIMYFSASPQSWFEVADTVWLWSRVFPHGKDDLFPGVTVVLLAAAGVGAALAGPMRGGGSDRLHPWVRRALLAVVAVSLAAIVAQLALGPVDTTIGGIPLRMRSLGRALWALALAGVPLVMLSPRTRRALAGRSPLVFYAAGVIVFAVLACGPVLRVGERAIMDPAPYGWLMALPGFGELRVPTQIKMVHVLCLAVAAALGYARLVPARAARARLMFGLCAFGILLDGWVSSTPIAQAQALWPVVEPADRPEPILELPLGPDFDAGATLRASIHHRRVMNGVSGYDPPYYVSLKEGLAARDPALLAAIASLGPLDIVVDGAADPDGAYARYAAAAPGAVLVGTDGTRIVFRVPRASAPPPLGAAVPIEEVRAIRHEANSRAMHDGRDDTSWADHPQRPDAWVSIDLGRPREVAGLTHALGTHLLAFPRRLAIDVSFDGRSWETAYDGPTFAQTFLGFVRSPRSGALQFGFAPRQARYVRLRQLATSTSEWRVTELTVHAPADP